MRCEEAVDRCLSRYVSFSGRACRSEFWWFSLLVVLSIAFTMAVAPFSEGLATAGVVTVAFLILPTVTVTVRRLHDIGRSGIMAALFLLPIAGQMLMLAWMARPGVGRRNRFGADPYSEDRMAYFAG